MTLCKDSAEKRKVEYMTGKCVIVQQGHINHVAF